MYLKSLEINGFKSFAEKTVLTFLPPIEGRNSITTIVGPNGSGKSNVSDAIRWVMGEQSMKQLRGKKSEDIIFAGSETKGKMGMASVMMTLDNSDGRAGLEYEELVIGRRIYRSGESEYIINGHAVRLLDLQLLLARAQFGNGAYAVIGQGMIDRLLLQSAVERKQFFDEATGIKEFQIKRHQAALRLVRTQENMTQAELLLHEVSPRLKHLSRQVKKLEERQEIEVRLREQQEVFYSTMWKYHQQNIDQIVAVMDNTEVELKQAQAVLEQTQQELANLAGQSSRQELFSELQSAYQELVNQKNRLERDRAVLQGKLQTEYSRSGNHQVGWLQTKVEELKLKQQEQDLVIKDAEQEQSVLQRAVTELERAKEDLAISRTSMRSEISSLETVLHRLRNDQTFFQATGLRAVQAILEARHSLGRVHGVVAQLGKVDKQYQLALDVAAGSNISSLVVEDEEVSRACIQYLREGQFGVATFLPLNKIRGREIPSFIHEYLGRSGVHGLAIDLVAYDEKFEHIFSFALGSTLVVEDFETAKQLGIGRVRMVTLEGDLFETSGAIRGGHRKGKQQGLSFSDGHSRSLVSEQASEQEEKIIVKKQALDQADLDFEKILSDLRLKEAAYSTIKNKVELLLDQKQTVDQELASLEREFALQTMSPEQYGDAMQQISKQKDQLDVEIENLERSLITQSEKIQRFNQEEEQKKQRVFSLQDVMQQQQHIVNGLVEQKNTKQVERAKLETKQEDLQHEAFQELQLTLESVISRGVPTVEMHQVEELQTQIQKSKYLLSLIGGIDDEVVVEYEQTKERYDGLMTQLEDLQKAMKDLDTLIDELDTIMKKKRDKAFKDIRREFSRYFEGLFDGRKADLVEVYGDEDAERVAGESLSENEQLGEADADSSMVIEDEQVVPKKVKKRKVLIGIDVVASPPGKKIQQLQTLSGGERTMTSIALMCAILKTNPSPFIVLDEVEAALDEANTLRIVTVLKELSHHSQFIIITHNRVTMHAADALYGVTMGNEGVSHLLSVKMEGVA